jgi:hypothetical protein
MLMTVLQWTGGAAVAMAIQEQVDLAADSAMKYFFADCTFLAVALGIISVARCLVSRHKRNANRG